MGDNLAHLLRFGYNREPVAAGEGGKEEDEDGEVLVKKEPGLGVVFLCGGIGAFLHQSSGILGVSQALLTVLEVSDGLRLTKVKGNVRLLLIQPRDTWCSWFSDVLLR
ncbi:hypothetical protein FH972_021684 [Carpinus fangiana]|uniref:Uncharacterized protein n=1 Tax=Carpinus fangiana TaxID=176857 RepID=A0A5N6KQM7_9ROSI|nr:hypothetical protein FH972_021684 [Carpinus fangiana]